MRYMFGGKAKVPLVIRTPQGAGHQLGATSQSLEAISSTPRAARRDSSDPCRCEGSAQNRMRQEDPGDVPRT